jgi:hypothetical protein
VQLKQQWLLSRQVFRAATATTMEHSTTLATTVTGGVLNPMAGGAPDILMSTFFKQNKLFFVLFAKQKNHEKNILKYHNSVHIEH